MRIFMVADSHFGMRSNSPEWLDIAAGWFESDFIPAARAAAAPGDALVHLGDVFDNRQSINLMVQHRGIAVFEELAKIFTGGVYVIAGNHDVMKKSSNDVCSLDCLKWIPNVHILKEPTVVKLGGARCLMMPWRPGPDEERACITAHSGDADYLFCHTNVVGMKLVDHVHTVADGTAITADDLSDFRRVLAGHIHLRQTVKGTVHMLGNPYQMTRSDMGDAKGWHTMDPATDELAFHENTTSPKFKRVYLPQWGDRPIDELVEECRGHMVDLYVPSSYFVSGYSVNALTAEVSPVSRSLEVVTYDDTDSAEPPPVDAGSQFSILDLCEKYVGGMGALDVPTRERVGEKLAELYKKLAEQ